MVTKKELIDFTEFCFHNHNLEIHGIIIEDYIKYINSRIQSESRSNSKNEHQGKDCGLNNISCSFIAFDSAKCNECPH